MTTTYPTRPARTSAWLIAACVAVALSLGAGQARAACTVSLVSNVAFGTYNVFSASALDSTGQISYRCSRDTHPSVRITLTRGSSPTYAARQLRHGADVLVYNLYRDSTRLLVWGDETPGTSAYYDKYPGSGRVYVSVFGRVPSGQDAAVGSYTDSITVVVNF
jgi:spore coat protein U-like protein